MRDIIEAALRGHNADYIDLRVDDGEATRISTAAATSTTSAARNRLRRLRARPRPRRLGLRLLQRPHRSARPRRGRRRPGAACRRPRAEPVRRCRPRRRRCRAGDLATTRRASPSPRRSGCSTSTTTSSGARPASRRRASATATCAAPSPSPTPRARTSSQTRIDVTLGAHRHGATRRRCAAGQLQPGRAQRLTPSSETLHDEVRQIAQRAVELLDAPYVEGRRVHGRPRPHAGGRLRPRGVRPPLRVRPHLRE